MADAAGPNAVRLDRALVDRGLARSRGQARDLVQAGAVEVDGAVANRPAQPVATDASVRLRPGRSGGGAGSVGRGSRKLDHALKTWPAAAHAVRGARCLDAGASTGGFTQVLLEHGARQVVALDVGHGQLAPTLRADPRVVDRPGTNVREVAPDDLGGPFDVVVADLSFISLTLVLPVLRTLCRPDGPAIVLVKPQFEVGRSRLAKSGVVRDDTERARAVADVAEAAQASGWGLVDLVRSPVAGGSGNAEYLLWLGAPGDREVRPDAVRSRVWTVVAGQEAPEPPR